MTGAGGRCAASCTGALEIKQLSRTTSNIHLWMGTLGSRLSPTTTKVVRISIILAPFGPHTPNQPPASLQQLGTRRDGDAACEGDGTSHSPSPSKLSRESSMREVEGLFHGVAAAK